MKTLRLTIKKQWFDMIISGEKTEEYREIKKHWINRLCSTSNMLDGLKEFEQVLFINGYSADAPQFLIECVSIDFGTGNPEWGAEEGKEYFVIKLGKQIFNPTINTVIKEEI